MAWFTFNGKHCEDDMKVRYAPAAVERGGFYAAAETQSADYTSRDGGMYYGTRKKPIEFALPCFYEEITHAERERITQWVAPGSRGKLVLDDRPYCYYDAVASDAARYEEYPVTTAEGVRYSGIFTPKFIAFDPAAKLMMKAYRDGDSRQAYEETGLIPENAMPPAPTVDSSSFLVYNPGTEKCGLIVRIAGNTGDGNVTFKNETTGQKCVVMNLTDELTTDASMWVELDGEKHQTLWKGSAEGEIDYRYHDDGYISLVPAMPFEKEVPVSYEAGSGKVYCPDGKFDEAMVGTYIYLNEDWHEVLHVINSNEMEVLWQPNTSAAENAIIAALNRIRIEKSDGVKLSRLEIDYVPKVR